MRIAARWRCILVALATVIAFDAAVAAEEPEPIAWRIHCNGGADSHGWVVLAFVESGEVLAEISTAIPNGTPENDVARRVRKNLRQALPKDRYRVDVQGGESVVVTADGHRRPFEIRLVRNTADGTEVSVTRE
ncbi:MAG: hypothetical protein ACREVI_14070 [Steroidobacteraceae bacterium]